MDKNLQNNDSLAESKESFLNLKTKNYGKILIFLFVGIIAVFRFIYKSSNFGIITIVSKDGAQKMSLMNKDIKYRGSNSCPKGYHIPTIYEWVEILKLWCENHPKCNTEYINYDNNFSGWGSVYYGGEEFDDFFHDFNIHLKRHFDFDIGFHKEKYLGVNFNYGFVCESLAFGKVGRDRDMSINPFDFDPELCIKPRYVRCFSDENLTPEY